MAEIGVIGAGYVGTATLAGMLRLGHRVRAIDTDAERVAILAAGRSPVDEPGVEPLLSAAVAQGRLIVSTDPSLAAGAEVVFICVPTPRSANGAADTSEVFSVAVQLTLILSSGAILVVKSTVPVGTCDALAELCMNFGIAVVSNPEFLREGHAFEDVTAPERVVVGGSDRRATHIVAQLYGGCDHSLIIETDCRSAELAKYASNAFLAVKLSFVNELADTAEKVGADLAEVTEIMGRDSRIGPRHLASGPGWGGSCLPKDTQALLATAAEHGVALLTVTAAVRANDVRIAALAVRIASIARAGGDDHPIVAVLGIAFKAGTSDLAASPAMRIANALLAEGVEVLAHDPAVALNRAPNGLSMVGEALVAIHQADMVAVLTEWPEYHDLPWEECSPLPIVDSRHVIDRERARRAGCEVIT